MLYPLSYGRGVPQRKYTVPLHALDGVGFKKILASAHFAYHLLCNIPHTVRFSSHIEADTALPGTRTNSSGRVHPYRRHT